MGRGRGGSSRARSRTSSTIGLGGVRLAGATAETALEAAVFAAGAADVERVVCGGREIVRDGRHLGLDVAAELRESIAAVSR